MLLFLFCCQCACSRRSGAWHGCDDDIRELSCNHDNDDANAARMSHMTTSQLVVLRKLCLLHLTSLMETFSPLHQTGSNWYIRSSCCSVFFVTGRNAIRFVEKSFVRDIMAEKSETNSQTIKPNSFHLACHVTSLHDTTFSFSQNTCAIVSV